MARGDQQTRQTQGEANFGTQSKFELEENHRSEGQMGESQSHHGLWSCGSKSSAKDHQRGLWQRKVNKSESWAKRLFHSTQTTGIQRCITLRSVSVVKPIISMQNVVRAGNIVPNEESPYIRNVQDGTMIKTDMNSAVCTMDMWICLDETGPVFSWQGQ